MELVVFDKTNMGGRAIKGIATIKLHRKAACRLNGRAVQQLGLNAGDTISFAQNSENPEEWYIVTGVPNGYEMRRNTQGDSLIFNAAKITNAIPDCLQVDENYAALAIDVEMREFANVDGLFYAISL